MELLLSILLQQVTNSHPIHLGTMLRHLLFGGYAKQWAQAMQPSRSFATIWPHVLPLSARPPKLFVTFKIRSCVARVADTQANAQPLEREIMKTHVVECSANGNSLPKQYFCQIWRFKFAPPLRTHRQGNKLFRKSKMLFPEDC